MKSPINTMLAAMLLLAVSCKKENNSTQNSDPGVQIGTQIWMTTNLNIAYYRNGDVIPQVEDPSMWAALTTGAWCYYSNDPANGAVYGKLYNWYAVHDPRGLAPTGWHVPSDSEWDVLSLGLGGNTIAGGKLKSTGNIVAGTGLWFRPNRFATNESGFTGLPGGWRYEGESFYSLHGDGGWWSSTEYYTGVAWVRNLDYDNGDVGRFTHGERGGFSVRCVKD